MGNHVSLKCDNCEDDNPSKWLHSGNVHHNPDKYPEHLCPNCFDPEKHVGYVEDPVTKVMKVASDAEQERLACEAQQAVKQATMAVDTYINGEEVIDMKWTYS